MAESKAAQLPPLPPGGKLAALKHTFVIGKQTITIDDIAAEHGISIGTEVHTKEFGVPRGDGKHKYYIEDELQPSRYLRIEFEGIYDSHYIGINSISLLNTAGDSVKYSNTEVDGRKVDGGNVKAAFPPRGWWAVVGGSHSVVLDLGTVRSVSHVAIRCANPGATPKKVTISDHHTKPAANSKAFAPDCFFQLSGETTSPEGLKFQLDAKDERLSCQQLTNKLNAAAPASGFASVWATSGELFVWYRRGLRRRAFRYYFGYDAATGQQLASLVGQIKEGGGQMVEKCEERSMSLEQLFLVRALIIARCAADGWTSSWDKSALRPDTVSLYDLADYMIKPLTKERNCAFKELFPNGPATPTYYISHWWGEAVLDFIQCCEDHACRLGLMPSEAKYWVCAYANRQHDLGSDLGTNPDDSSFRRAMQLASSGVLLLLDPRATVFTRIWCDFEIFKTLKAEEKVTIDVVTRSAGQVHHLAMADFPNEHVFHKNEREKHFPSDIIAKGVSAPLQDGDASMPIDKVRILNCFLGRMDDLDNNNVIKILETHEPAAEYNRELAIYDSANATLHAEFAAKAWPMALSKEGISVTNFHGLDLAAAVRRDVTRRSLTFDFPSYLSMTDSELARLSSAWVPALKDLRLNISACVNLTNAGLAELQLPRSLTHLDLDVRYLPKVDPGGLVHIMKQLPASLRRLEMNLIPHQDGFGDNVLMPLAKSLANAEHLAEFEVDLWGFDVSSKTFVSMAQSFPASIKKVKFRCILSSPTENAQALVDFVDALPPGVEWLGLNCNCAHEHVQTKKVGPTKFSQAFLPDLAKAVSKLPKLSECYCRTGYPQTDSRVKAQLQHTLAGGRGVVAALVKQTRAGDVAPGRYFICGAHGRNLGASNKHEVYLHTNKLGWEKWRIEDAGNGQVFICGAHGRNLGASNKHEVYLHTNKLGWEKWRLEPVP